MSEVETQYASGKVGGPARGPASVATNTIVAITTTHPDMPYIHPIVVQSPHARAEGWGQKQHKGPADKGGAFLRRRAALRCALISSALCILHSVICQWQWQWQ